MEVVTVRGRATGTPALRWDAVEPALRNGAAPPGRRRIHTRSGTVEAKVLPRTAMMVDVPIPGPAIITDPEATTFVAPDETAVLHRSGAIEVTW
ncbi:MAG: hypothetical protein GWN79_26755 [Actinobacteria bacterium]|nr:hypothetical protein [Actinomycetota bacterium]NIU22420.1 hypothetical protein [Actinomycetota bacterium]NIV58998.1 hypothetical protein [Actinomycetota bacterium]